MTADSVPAPMVHLPAEPISDAMNIIFDGPPGPESGRFVEVENDAGQSIRVGEWIDRGDGMWALRIEPPKVQWAEIATLCGHGMIICARCDMVPDSWNPNR